MLKSGLTAIVLSLVAGAASASTVSSNPFDFRAVFGPDEPQSSVTAGSVAGSCDPFDGTGCDGGIDSNGTTVFIDWVDGDSFDIGIAGNPETDFNVRITDLLFAGDAEVTSLTFNLGGGDPANSQNIDGFLFDPVNNPTAPDAPSISTDVFLNPFTDTYTLSIDFNDVSDLLWADAVTMRFDVGFADPVSVVPLPAGGLMLLTGLAGFAGARRLRNRG